MKKLALYVYLLLAFGITKSFAQQDKQLFTNQIGVQAYTYRNSFPNSVTATLDTIKTLGITEIEGPNPKNTTPEEFKKLLDERGISMPSLGADYGLISKDPESFIKLARFSAQLISWWPGYRTEKLLLLMMLKKL